ncbi:hypothetical protein [Solibacillus sp. FSL K6-1126]|uniref:hypothetical protein n=1 Tax=Solibacillus sp. FSL K6-1126 TaxID=2921463 RepID=UPI0030FCD5B3
MMHLKSNRGLTLVEVIAITLITSIIAILIFSIIQTSVKQKELQTQETQDLFDITYALKIITKEIRYSTAIEVKTSELILTIPNSTFDKSITYLIKENQLIKKIKIISNGNVINPENVEIITDSLGCGEFKLDEDNINVVMITLSNTNSCANGQNTEIHLRKGH